MGRHSPRGRRTGRAGAGGGIKGRGAPVYVESPALVAIRARTRGLRLPAISCPSPPGGRAAAVAAVTEQGAALFFLAAFGWRVIDARGAIDQRLAGFVADAAHLAADARVHAV